MIPGAAPQIPNGLVAMQRPPTDKEREEAKRETEKVRRLQVRTNAAQIAGNMLAGHAPSGDTFTGLARAVVEFIET